MRPEDMVLMPTHLRFRGRRFPVTRGRGGVRGDKREGDGATPRGVLRVEAMLYRPDRMAPPAPWAEPIRPGDLWSDDSRDPDYNCPVRVPHGFSHEAMRRSDPLYDLVIVTDWNRTEIDPVGGSAIFLHQWRGPGRPTEGCLAFRRDHLRWIAARLTPDTRVVIA